MGQCFGFAEGETKLGDILRFVALNLELLSEGESVLIGLLEDIVVDLTQIFDLFDLLCVEESDILQLV